MEQPLVSVAITLYRQAHLLERCLKGVFAQDCGPIELLVCDDHSCDFSLRETEAWIRENAPENIVRVRVSQQTECGGPAAVAQAALDQAEGRYFVRLSGDETFAGADSLKTAIQRMENGAEALFCLRQGWTWLQEDVARQLVIYGPHQLAVPSGVVWSTEALRRMGGYDREFPHLAEESALLRAAVQEADLQAVTEPLVRRFCEPGPSSQPEQVRLDDALRAEEQARLMRAVSLPWLTQKRYRRSLLRAKLEVWQREKKGELLLGWRAWPLRKKLLWRLGNLPLLWATAALQRRHRASLRSWFLLTVASCALLWTGLVYLPEWPGTGIWAVVFLLSLVVSLWLFGCRVASVALRKLMRE